MHQKCCSTPRQQLLGPAAGGSAHLVSSLFWLGASCCSGRLCVRRSSTSSGPTTGVDSTATGRADTDRSRRRGRALDRWWTAGNIAAAPERKPLVDNALSIIILDSLSCWRNGTSSAFAGRVSIFVGHGVQTRLAKGRCTTLTFLRNETANGGALPGLHATSLLFSAKTAQNPKTSAERCSHSLASQKTLCNQSKHWGLQPLLSTDL